MKKIVLFRILLLGGVLFGGIIYWYSFHETHVSVLGYHGILPKKLNTSYDEFIVDQEKFEQELKYLQKKKYQTLTLDEFYDWMKKKKRKKHKAVLITFDDGYQNNYDYAFPLLKKYKMKATVFIIGEKAENNIDNYLSLKTIKKAKKEFPNITFASHSYQLHNHDKKDYKMIQEDITKMKSIINTKFYAYPHGESSKEYRRALKENGYKMAFTFGPGKEHRKATKQDNTYKVPRLNISQNMSFQKFKLRLSLPF